MPAKFCHFLLRPPPPPPTSAKFGLLQAKLTQASVFANPPPPSCGRPLWMTPKGELMLNVYLLIRLSYLIRLCNSRVLKYYTCVKAIITLGLFLGLASVDHDALRIACVVRYQSTEVLQGN